MSTAAPGSPRRHTCPLCGKPPHGDHAPFCSQGCRDRDLLKWLGDAYKVPGPPAADDAAESLGGGLDSGA
jgi:endogenous inhibitor of DNA gyrase (YacG/DUF329 family)